MTYEDFMEIKGDIIEHGRKNKYHAYWANIYYDNAFDKLVFGISERTEEMFSRIQLFAFEINNVSCLNVRKIRVLAHKQVNIQLKMMYYNDERCLRIA